MKLHINTMIWLNLSKAILAVSLSLQTSTSLKGDYIDAEPRRHEPILEQVYQSAWSLCLGFEVKKLGCIHPLSIMPMLDDKTIAENRQSQQAFYTSVVTYIDSYYLRIDPNLLADSTRLQIAFPIEEKEIMGSTIRGCIFSFGYPQISGLADTAVQDRLNQTLKNEILRDDRWPRAPGSLSCEDPFLETVSEEQKRISISSSARMRCHVAFARGSLVSINCIGAVSPVPIQLCFIIR